MQKFDTNPGNRFTLLGNGMFMACVEFEPDDPKLYAPYWSDALFSFEEINIARPGYDHGGVRNGTMIWWKGGTSVFITVDCSIFVKHLMDYKLGIKKVHIHPS